MVRCKGRRKRDLFIAYLPLRMLRKLQDAGHEIIFVIGGFTGRGKNRFVQIRFNP